MARRRIGGTGTARTVFSVLWIALGGLSAYYLFTVLTGTAPAVSRTAGPAAPAQPGPAAAPVAAAAPAGLSSEQLSVIDRNLQTLSQHLAKLDQRLRPIENFIGPAAKLPPSDSASTPPPQALPKLEPMPRTTQRSAPTAAPAPRPEPAPTAAEAPTPAPAPAPVVAAAPPEPPKPAAAPVVLEPPQPVVAAPPPPPAPPKPPVTAAPPPPPNLIVATPTRPAPPPPVVTTAPPATTSPPATTAPPAAAAPAAAAGPVDIAALDPVALPPAANDGSTRYGIEIGSVAKRDELRPLWREYLTKHAALVAGLQPRRVRAPDNRWRLIAGPFANAQDAEGACSLFKRADRPCAATVYAGDAL